MKRTSKRAIPSGTISPLNAVLFGFALISSGLAAIFYVFGAVTLLFTILGIAFYVLVYTLLLKRRTRWNVVIGGVAGTFAALAGWTATGNALSLTPLLVGVLNFFWTPGHLWGLAIKAGDEYRGASIPMLPVKLGLKKAASIVLKYNVVVFCLSLLFPLLRLSGWLYLIPVTIAGTVMLSESRKLSNQVSEKQAFRVFKVSTPYLAVVMSALLIDRILVM